MIQFSILYRIDLDQLSGNIQLSVKELINQVSTSFFRFFHWKINFFVFQKHCRELEEVVNDTVFNSLSNRSRPTPRQYSGECHGADQSGEYHVFFNFLTETFFFFHLETLPGVGRGYKWYSFKFSIEYISTNSPSIFRWMSRSGSIRWVPCFF